MYLATFMKLKIAGFFRSLLGKGETNQPEPTPDSERPVAPLIPASAHPPANQDPASPNYYSLSQSQPAEPTAPDPEHPNEIAIPLLAIANSLPMDLKAKLIGTPAPGRLIYLPLEIVISQLAFGAVKISFGELRSLAPGIFVTGINGNFDTRPVTLPLNEILARINPALLARRPATQKFEVAEDITGPFAGHGRGITFTDQPLKGTPVPPAAAQRSVKPELPSPPKRDIKPVLPGLPTRENKPSATMSFAPPPAPPASPIPFAGPPKQAKNGNGNVIGAGNGNGSRTGNGTGNGSGQADKNNGKPDQTLPPFKFTTTPPPIPVAPVPPPAPPIARAPVAPAPKTAPKPMAEVQPSFSVWLQELAEKWPDEVKTEIISQGLGSAKVPLPMQAVEPGLKRGRLTMAWRELRTFINPDSPQSLVDDLELDLPLHVVAPAFLAAQRKLSAQRHARVAVSEEIPNLFFGFPQPETPAPAPPAAPATPSAPVIREQPKSPTTFRPNPLPRMAPSSAQNSGSPAPNLPLQNALRNGDTNIFAPGGNASALAGDSDFLQCPPSPSTDFLSRQMQPKDVVAHALALPGVAGAVVALADGLRVAGQVPAEFNADTVAAFLPQIYERVNQCTRELRMGALNNVSFTVGSVPWKIFRVNSIYFATFGRADEVFPKAELAQLAAGLNRKSKQ
jgi:predicted regulator of Ras-like GTPase activity (Roadblock/LC7/MglB family)